MSEIYRYETASHSLTTCACSRCYAFQAVTSIDEGQIHDIGLKSDNIKHDKALALLTNRDVVFDNKSGEAKAVLRKIDLHIMPVLLLVYMLMLVDKNSLSYANIMGIKTDVGLNASEYSWLGSIV